MPVRKPIPLSWRGPESIAEIVSRLAKRKPVMLSLPRNFHHVLTVRLCNYARVHGTLDITGGSDLLERLGEIAGLDELTRLCEPVRFAGASVRLRSPPPQVHLFFPAEGGRRAGHARPHQHLAIRAIGATASQRTTGDRR